MRLPRRCRAAPNPEHPRSRHPTDVEHRGERKTMQAPNATALTSSESSASSTSSRLRPVITGIQTAGTMDIRSRRRAERPERPPSSSARSPPAGAAVAGEMTICVAARGAQHAGTVGLQSISLATFRDRAADRTARFSAGNRDVAVNRSPANPTKHGWWPSPPQTAQPAWTSQPRRAHCLRARRVRMPRIARPRVNGAASQPPAQ